MAQPTSPVSKHVAMVADGCSIIYDSIDGIDYEPKRGITGIWTQISPGKPRMISGELSGVKYSI